MYPIVCVLCLPWPFVDSTTNRLYPIADVPSTAHTVDSVPHNFNGPQAIVRISTAVDRSCGHYRQQSTVVGDVPGIPRLTYLQSEYRPRLTVDRVPTIRLSFYYHRRPSTAHDKPVIDRVPATNIPLQTKYWLHISHSPGTTKPKFLSFSVFLILFSLFSLFHILFDISHSHKFTLPINIILAFPHFPICIKLIFPDLLH